jgi:uncharacterized protein YqhQ
LIQLSSSDGKSPDRKELSTELAMGGQAVIEGVMMRSPHRVAVAVRKADGEIAVMTFPYEPVTRRIKWLKLPIIRGAAGMVEALKIGIDALNWSAESAAPTDDQAPAVTEKRRRSWIAVGLSMLLALVVGLGLFMYLPYWVAKLAVGGDQGQLEFHLIAGGVRIAVLLAYLWGISLVKDIHRVFQYHGSEHKTIFAFESAVDLTPENVSRQSRFHPRCGTSFLLIVALSAILFFVIVDTIVVAVFGAYPNVLTRFLVHLPLIPVVAGLSYELLKASAKHVNNRLIRALIQPGLWLQRITTQEPDLGMCEVAIAALKAALTEESSPVGVVPPASEVQLA